jgi:hypothetical protein
MKPPSAGLAHTGEEPQVLVVCNPPHQEAVMSKEAIAAFLRQVAEDANLQQALVEFAAHHGFKFTPHELRELDLLSLSGSIPSAPEEADGDSVDSGFGMGEYPA